MEKFDVTIIGAGPGGTAAARLLAEAGMRVALAEDRDWGGTCLNRGCVPTKLLLGAVAPLGVLDGFARRHIIEGRETVNFQALNLRVRRFVDTRRRALALELIHKGVHLFKGRGICLSPTEVRIEERDGSASHIQTRYLIFACGTRTSSFPGLRADHRTILSSTTLLQQTAIPESLIIAGGGTIGVEMADIYYHLGSRVVIAEAAPQLAPTEDEDIAAHLRWRLERRGILCLTGVRAVSLEKDRDDRARLTLADGAVYTAAKGLIAAGRMPNTEWVDAESAGCALNRRGFITTDPRLRSSVNSWAIGDVNGRVLLAHAATHQGEYVARCLLGQEEGPYEPGPCPACFHGSLEIMRVGATESEAAALGGEVMVSKAQFAGNVIAQAAGSPTGFVKVVWRNGTICGIAAIGNGVSQLTLSAQLLLLGQYHGAKLNSFMVAYPTLDETLTEAIKAPKTPSQV